MESDGSLEQRITIDSEVGLGNGKRTPVHLGRFWGVYFDADHPNKDFALVRLAARKNGYVTAETLRKVKKFKLEKVTPSLVLIPLGLLRICEPKEKEQRKNVGRK